MTRRTPAVNGVHVNGDAPPPSTLAAQIVQIQTRAAAPQQNGEKATFSQLLHEILHNRAATPETDVNVNVKLISVVAEAGLAPLGDGNPFAQLDHLIPRAIDSIAVIEATIKRQPEVLFIPITPDGPQLLLPLLARLTAACGRQGLEGLRPAALLNAIFKSLQASIGFWQSANVVRDVLQDCVQDALLALETAATNKTDFSFNLPPARSVAKLWQQSQHSIALPHGCQASISAPSHAFMLCLELLQVSGPSEQRRDESRIRLQVIAPAFRKVLENAKQWEIASLQMLAHPFDLHALAAAFDEEGNVTVPSSVQPEVAVALIKALKSDGSAVKDSILPALLILGSDVSFDTLHVDLKLAITTVVCRLCTPQVWPEPVEALQQALRQDNIMADSELQTTFQQLSITPPQTCSGPRKRKRRRLESTPDEDASEKLVKRITRLLTGTESLELNNLHESAASNYVQLNDDEKCAAWQCLIDNSSIDLQVTLLTISKLLELPELHQSKRPRLLSILAVRACVEKTSDAQYLDMARSTFGQLCLRSLHSTLRELRVAAGHCLAAFIRSDLPDKIRTANRQTAPEYLRVLSDRDVANFHETLVGAWSQIAQVCDDSELNLALLRLVDYLGHPNPLICGLAFEELEQLIEIKQQSADDLFRPFWGSIALSVVQDLHSRPQKIQQLCDLVGTNVHQFLLQTQQETIPSLVATKKQSILQKIASARGNGTTVQDLCLQPRTNMAAILALLLAQPGPDTEDAAMACLTEVAPPLRGHDLSNLVKIDSTLVACNMLKHIGDEGSDRKSRAYQAFHTFANVAERRPGQGKAHAKPSRTVNEFFDTHILGIMTFFSDVLENTQSVHPIREKRRCVRAIGEMISLAKQQVNVALPQIKAALQSAMEHEALCETAFSSWLKLLSVLTSEDIAPVVDQTFALILRHWSNLSSELQQRLHERIGILIKDHNQVIQQNILTLPSLASIPTLSKLAAEIERFRSQRGVESHCSAFAGRLQDESATVVLRALEELCPFLEQHQEFVHISALAEKPPSELLDLLRALLDATGRYCSENTRAADLCGRALGIVGCLDPNRVENIRKQRQALVLSNFDTADEVVDWALVLLEDILVKAFKSVTNARAQGFLAFVMQELLRFCGINDGTVLRPRASQAVSVHQKWLNMPDNARITLTPFVNSRYTVTRNATISAPNRSYPGFNPDAGHSTWLRSLAYDLTWKAKGDNAQMVFPLIGRVIRGHDLSIASFMLPYAVLNVVLGGTVSEVKDMSEELLAVLGCQPTGSAQQETVKQCSECVFTVLDYMSTWLQEKKKALGESRAAAYRGISSSGNFNEAKDMAQIDTVERFLASIPAEVIAAQAVVCGSYARALFHWEQYIRQERPLIPSARPPRQYSDDQTLYEKLQDIYSQIEEPDGLEGISAHLSFLNEDQQAMQHAKAGRWTAAQAWYELQLSDNPQDTDVEERLLACLRETGRYEPLLRYADSFINSRSEPTDAQDILRRLLPDVVEAHWMTGDLDGMMLRLDSSHRDTAGEFNVGVARILASIVRGDENACSNHISDTRALVMQNMSVSRTSSVQASHEDLRKLHVLHEIESLRSGTFMNSDDPGATLDRRLAIIGSYTSDKQYVMGVRRALMQTCPDKFNDISIGTSWLNTAKLARQSGNIDSAYNAVLKAHDCGNKDAKMEEARLLWRQGHQRHAIQSLETAIRSGAFDLDENETRPDQSMSTSTTISTRSTEFGVNQNVLGARAQLLLAKWLDASGQSQTKDMIDKYQQAARLFQRWEKGHYYLGKHYQKLLEAEKALPKDKQSTQFSSGESARLVIENLIRSVPFGNKYWHQTIPKILTLWLDIGSHAVSKPRNEDQAIFDRRVKALQASNSQIKKYFDRVPPFVFWSAVPQMISRLTHPHGDVWKLLCNLLTRIASAHPSQTLWSLLAVIKSSDRTRVERGTEIINRLKDPKTKPKDTTYVDMRIMIPQAQKLSDGLLHACEAPVEPRASSAKLSKDLGFNHKLAPNSLVVPVEMTLTSSLPNGSLQPAIKGHKAFVQNKITVQSFEDDVLVLSSLQRPRKLTVKGSDGKRYGLLCKPKDDLRKDQRLMEFNGIINRALKRDSESSKRRLYIKTYAVTPLSEESGIIEWVEGIKPIRDILLNLYARRGVRPNYTELKHILDQASSGPEHAHIFGEQVLSKYPATLHEWFAEIYPEPEAWFAARLRYARSAAVMSMTGHVLGLGDRHGENILLEESTGGVFHVDFNCLFDKGLTFEKPELVPFRLTHNMVDAMGPYGCEGPFRKSSELTMRLLRQSKDTLMTILETFLYDPTTDFIGQKKKRSTASVPETPQEILDSVDGKLKGLLRGETVPLGVEGYVDALIRESTNPFYLASMYIGWCAFL